MVEIPAGQFLMGSPADEPERLDDERPKIQVSVSSFAAGKFDVTGKQYSKFVEETKRPTANTCILRFPKTHYGASVPQADDHPVVCVTWVDARDYTQWLSKKTGKRYRLLSEAAWEYAARTGSTTAYP